MDMEIKISKREIQPVGLLAKITGILFGIFITSLIFAICIKAFQVTGFYIAIALNAILIFSGFYFTKKGGILRIITFGILITLILGAILYVVGMTMLSNILEDF